MDPVSEIFSSSQASRKREMNARLFKDDPEVAVFLQFIDKMVAEHDAQHKADSKPSQATLAAEQAKREFDQKWAFLKSMVEQAQMAMAGSQDDPDGAHAREKYVFWQSKLSQMSSQAGLGLSI